jgi:type I restriction enzyme, S subunit
LSDFPEHWILTTFESICDSGQYGWTTRATDRGIVKFLRTTDITKGQIDWDSVPYCQDVPSNLDKYLLKVNDILISRAGSVGFSTLIGNVPFSTVFASYLIRFIPSEGIEARYVAYFLKSTEYWQQVAEASSGIALSNINAKRISEISIPLAPFNEQKRIADRLDVLIAQIEVCLDRLDRIPLILKRFRQSVLSAAITGELTQDWRVSINRSLNSWQEISSESIFPYITSGSRGWAGYYSQEGALFLRVGNLDRETIELDLQNPQYVKPPGGAEGKRTRIEIGDILISITADIGMVAFIREDIGEAYINQHLCLARQTGKYSGAYLAYYLASPLGGVMQLKEMQRGVTKKGLTLGDIRSVTFLIPELDEQEEIVCRIEQIFAYADLLEQRYKKACVQVEQLTPTLLNMAFCGELVPQDPDDEPASVLLERIRIAKAAQPIKQRVPTIRRSTMTKLSQESVKEVIHQLPNDKFSFDELRGKIPGDYDLLKDILFTLLGETEPILQQVFDKEAKSIFFVRESK